MHGKSHSMDWLMDIIKYRDSLIIKWTQLTLVIRLAPRILAAKTFVWNCSGVGTPLALDDSSEARPFGHYDQSFGWYRPVGQNLQYCVSGKGRSCLQCGNWVQKTAVILQQW